MKSLKCSDIGEIKDCDFEAKGKTDEEVIENAFKHAAEVHKDQLEKMTEGDKQNIVEKMKELLAQQE